MSKNDKNKKMNFEPGIRNVVVVSSVSGADKYETITKVHHRQTRNNNNNNNNN